MTVQAMRDRFPARSMKACFDLGETTRYPALLFGLGRGREGRKTMSKFHKATKFEARLRMALTGPSGSGKTFTSLKIATALGGPVALVDTERSSASKYADLFEFDVCELESFHPQRYIEAIKDAEAAGYNVLILDSLSHAWAGKGGVLDLVDQATKRAGKNNSFGDGWREGTKIQNELIDTLTSAKLHIIATMRSKMSYSQEKDEKGKPVIKKLGLQPIQRDGVEYEFDITGDLDQDNTMIVSKSRCPELQGAVLEKPGAEVAEILSAWLKGEPIPAQSTPPAGTNPPSNGKSTNGHASPEDLRALEAQIHKAQIDREDFMAFLVSIKFLSPRAEDGQLHLHDIAASHLSRILDGWKEAMKLFSAYTQAEGAA